MLIKEKVRQASELVREMGLDCWLTFTRESAINGDPTLVYLAPGPVTWHSAFLVGADGRARAVVGLYDKRGVEETGAYETVEGYVTSIRETLQEWLKEMSPRTIGVNFSKGSEICDGLTHGMFLTLQDILGEIGMADRMVSAEKLVSALRERKSAAEIGFIREAIAATEGIFDRVAGFIKPGRTEKEIAGFMLDIVRAEGRRRAGTKRPVRPSSRARTRPRLIIPRRSGASNAGMSSIWISGSRSRNIAPISSGRSTFSGTARRKRRTTSAAVLKRSAGRSTRPRRR